MRPQTILGMLAALVVAAAPLAAQTATPTPAPQETDRHRRDAEAEMRKAEQQMREAERAMREAARKLAEMNVKKMRMDRKVVVWGDHARLGVVLRHEANPATDKVGAVVEALTPGSPAEDAGLRPGDVITKFNGKPLTSGETDADEDESAPTARLMEMAGSLKDGDVVNLEYRRGEATSTVSVTARRPVGPRVRVLTVPDADMPHVTEMPDMPEVDVEVPDFSGFDFDFSGGHSWGSLELVALTPELGAYFGADQGLLVVRSPKDDALKLQGGDVILKIGDRAPGSPAQAMRILRSYDAGDTVPLLVLRRHEKLTLSAQVPERRGAMPRLAHPAHPAPPAHPAAPAAPDAPPAPPAPPAPGSPSTSL